DGVSTQSSDCCSWMVHGSCATRPRSLLREQRVDRPIDSGLVAADNRFPQISLPVINLQQRNAMANVELIAAAFILGKEIRGLRVVLLKETLDSRSLGGPIQAYGQHAESLLSELLLEGYVVRKKRAARRAPCGPEVDQDYAALLAVDNLAQLGSTH